LTESDNCLFCKSTIFVTQTTTKENEFRFLEFEGIQIATFIEGHQQEEHTEYHFQNILLYVERGQLNIREGDKLHVITKGNFCLVRKLRTVSYLI